MKLFYSLDHDGKEGVATVAVAGSAHEARNLIKGELDKRGLNAEKPFTLREIDLSEPGVLILRG